MAIDDSRPRMRTKKKCCSVVNKHLDYNALHDTVSTWKKKVYHSNLCVWKSLNSFNFFAASWYEIIRFGSDHWFMRKWGFIKICICKKTEMKNDKKIQSWEISTFLNWVIFSSNFSCLGGFLCSIWYFIYISTTLWIAC